MDQHSQQAQDCVNHHQQRRIRSGVYDNDLKPRDKLALTIQSMVETSMKDRPWWLIEIGTFRISLAFDLFAWSFRFLDCQHEAEGGIAICWYLGN